MSRESPIVSTTQPVLQVQTGGATYFTNVLNDSGEVVVAAGTRQQGVWIINEHATLAVFAGSSAANDNSLLPFAAKAPSFIPGNGAIFCRSISGTPTVSGWWI